MLSLLHLWDPQVQIHLSSSLSPFRVFSNNKPKRETTSMKFQKQRAMVVSIRNYPTNGWDLPFLYFYECLANGQAPVFYVWANDTFALISFRCNCLANSHLIFWYRPQLGLSSLWVVTIWYCLLLAKKKIQFGIHPSCCQLVWNCRKMIITQNYL